MSRIADRERSVFKRMPRHSADLVGVYRLSLRRGSSQHCVHDVGRSGVEWTLRANAS